MIKKIQVAVSAILLAALAVYSFAQRSTIQTREEDSRVALLRHESRVIQALKLTAKQKADYDDLKASVKAETAKLASMTSGQANRGRQINADYHNGMKRIFTPAQYQKYMDMWAPVDLNAGQAPMASGTPFGGTDELILNYLKVTPSQWNQYRAYQKENEIKLQQYRDLFHQDRTKGAYFGNELNRWTRSEMYRILGEDKYYEWVRLWDQVMSPYIANGAAHAGQTLTAGGSSLRPVAGKVGGG
ncbi:MAG: hypothetical protein IT203_04540 [Fimbriimonadaceae bacterium]|nr:hypothetical protein [Fimbriimonadaceae bacterium]